MSNLILQTRQLPLTSCPHCLVDSPTLNAVSDEITTTDLAGDNKRIWRVYACRRCGGLVASFRKESSGYIHEFFPKYDTVDESLPAKPKRFLDEAIRSISAPSGAIMLCGSSIDAMLKDKGYSEGSLYKRIETAATDHLITSSMAEWAHQVRLDANDQRHADEDADLPTIEDAKRAISFTKAFAEYLYVLPAKVAKGISELEPSNEGVIVDAEKTLKNR